MQGFQKALQAFTGTRQQVLGKPIVSPWRMDHAKFGIQNIENVVSQNIKS